MIAVAEMSERFLRDYDEGFKYYNKAFDFDPERADPLFYIGQRKRLNGDVKGAIEPLLTAARMLPPVRSVFQWVAMYDCIATVELARAVQALLVSEGYTSVITFDVSACASAFTPHLHPPLCSCSS
jgi:tetratricopeptide (TPR) repeat protein